MKEKPSLGLLFNSVSTASATWKDARDSTKLGRVKDAFSRLCQAYQSHSNLVAVLPTNDNYISLLTGSLSAIAQVSCANLLNSSLLKIINRLLQATVNHQEIATGVATTLEELSQDLSYWNDLLEECSDDEAMGRYMMELYVIIFEFLTAIFVKWSKSSWRRYLPLPPEYIYKPAIC